MSDEAFRPVIMAGSSRMVPKDQVQNAWVEIDWNFLGKPYSIQLWFDDDDNDKCSLIRLDAEAARDLAAALTLQADTFDYYRRPPEDEDMDMDEWLGARDVTSTPAASTPPHPPR